MTDFSDTSDTTGNSPAWRPDILDSVRTFLGAGEHGADFDAEGITDELVASYDLTGWSPTVTFNDIDHAEFNAILQRYDQAVPDPVDITATIDRPTVADQYGTDWNWAETAHAAWLAAATTAGVVVQAENHEVSGDYAAARVQVNGAWYELELRDDDLVRAALVD